MFTAPGLKERMNGSQRRIRGWWVVAGAAVVVLVGLSLGPDVNPGGSVLDRLSHAVAYAALTAVILVARDRHGRSGWRSVLFIALGLMAFGGAMEFAQAAVHRDATVVDGLADAVGIAAVVAVHSLLRLRGNRRERIAPARPSGSGPSSPP
jgi:VanZ family protein